MTEERTLYEGRPRRYVLWLMLALLGVLALSAAAGGAADAKSGKHHGGKQHKHHNKHHKHGGNGGTSETPILRKYQVPVNMPEGVVYDDQTSAFYGGSSFSSDGTVYKATLDGNAEVFMKTGFDGAGNPDTTRTQTHGFNVDSQDRLYIAGVTTGFLHVYNLQDNGKKIATFSTGPGGYINDVAISPVTGDVYFTDSVRPILWHVTKQQVEDGGGTPEAIQIGDKVDYGPSTRTNNKLEANGIRFTPDGKYIIFDDLNNGALYRFDPASNPANPDIQKIGGVTPAQLGNIDGLEFLNSNTLYAVDNSGTPNETPGSFDESPERVVKMQLSDDYLSAKVLKSVTSPEFRTPTAVSLAPDNTLLINNAEFFDTNGPPYVVDRIPQF